MTDKEKRILHLVKGYILTTIGMGCFVIGWCIFLLPNNLISGGVTGVSSILYYATKGAVGVGVSYFIINAVLIIAALCILGKGFGGKTIYAAVLVSVGLSVVPGWIPADFIQKIALDNGKLMSTIMGGILAGLGIGMTIAEGGSSGGTDIIAMIVNKYRNVSPGRMILFMDVVIILSSLFFPSYTPDGNLMPFVDKLTTVVYGFILIVINSTVLDMYVSGSKQSVQVFILSRKSEEIADMIAHRMNRGVTVLDGEGWYSKQSLQVLMVLTRKADLNVLLRNVKNIDPEAFLSVASVTGVYGKGFDQIKGRHSRKKQPQIEQ